MEMMYLKCDIQGKPDQLALGDREGEGRTLTIMLKKLCQESTSKRFKAKKDEILK
jgi:hypothetical protein